MQVQILLDWIIISDATEKAIQKNIVLLNTYVDEKKSAFMCWKDLIKLVELSSTKNNFSENCVKRIPQKLFSWLKSVKKVRI